MANWLVAATDGVNWLKFSRKSMAAGAAPVEVLAQWPEMKKALSREWRRGRHVPAPPHGDTLEMSVGDGHGAEKIQLEPLSAWTDAPQVVMETAGFKG